MKNLVLGIDTSNYTTSIAVVDDQGNLIFECRKILDVKEGARGLRQSDALFQHVINMPALFEELSKRGIGHRIKTVSVSNRPRAVENSYMPVFRAGQSFGQTIAKALNCEYKEFSHQEGHIEAAKGSINQSFDNPFIAVQISGGTTEILYVKNNHKVGYTIDILGGTSDISAGQFIDRIGVKLGLGFPAGKQMDSYAMQAECMGKEMTLPVSVKDTYVSFSGPETSVHRQIEEIFDKNIIAKAVLKCVAKSLEKIIINASKRTGLSQILLIGGVASSEYIKNYLLENLKEEKYKIYFGDKLYCTDNAVGTALLGIKK
ncbi:Kae1-like domain-containing protein [Marinisporobacter balticus]|nr:O-sialoglycoprotein endopeptidase [Marinisporobacter balticus]